MRIGFLCKHNPFDRNSFSGTAYYMREALARAPGVELSVLGRHAKPSLVNKALNRLRPAPSPRPEDMDPTGLDWIVAAVSSEFVAPVAARSSAPIAHVTDATPGFLREFYGWEVDPARDVTEREALAAAGLAIYSSAFMAERAAAEFPGLPTPLTAVPFGVNLDDLPTGPAEKPPLDPIRLLFVGRDWERKGGDVALAALDVLRDRGVAARLTVIGCDPAAARGRADVAIHPFLDKNRPADYATLTGAFREAHVFLLPTRADCTPMVVAEANAYATPVLITETGGIPSLMAPGANGEMLPEGADGAAYADRIMALAAGDHAALSRASFAHYRERLNWSAWARDVVAALAAA